MRKLLITIIASTAVSFAFAAPVASQAVTKAAPAFDNTKIKCGDKVLKNGDSTDALTGICKGFKFGKGHAGFLDDNSGKQVMCQEKHGKLILTSCQPKS